jgi:hypothetical protein
MPNAGLQLRRAISIQAEGKRLLEKHAIAPSAASLCWTAAKPLKIIYVRFAFATNEATPQLAWVCFDFELTSYLRLIPEHQ